MTSNDDPKYVTFIKFVKKNYPLQRIQVFHMRSKLIFWGHLTTQSPLGKQSDIAKALLLS